MKMPNGDQLNVLLFLILLFGLFIANLLAPNRGEVSELENRRLAQMPEFTVDNLLDGSYFRDLEEVVADHFVMREQFVLMGRQVERVKGFSSGVQLVTTMGNNVQDNLQETPDSVGAEPADGGQVGEYLILKDRVVGLHFYDPAASERYAEVVNRYTERLGPDAGVRVYAMIVPSNADFIPEPYRSVTMSQKEAIDHAYASMAGGIVKVDAYKQLEAHQDEYVYFRTDHHWTALGAYYAYLAFAEAAGFEPVPLEKYETVDFPGMLGSFYKATLSQELKKHPDTLTFYVPFVKHEFVVYVGNVQRKRDVMDLGEDSKDGKYGIFLGGDFALGKMTTAVKDGKTILLVRDSYANAFAPFLIPHYKAIYLVDPRYYDGNILELAGEIGADEVLFLNSAIVTSYTGIADLMAESLEI